MGVKNPVPTIGLWGCVSFTHTVPVFSAIGFAKFAKSLYQLATMVIFRNTWKSRPDNFLKFTRKHLQWSAF